MKDIFELETKQMVAGHDHSLLECEYWTMHELETKD